MCMNLSQASSGEKVWSGELTIPTGPTIAVDWDVQHQTKQKFSKSYYIYMASDFFQDCWAEVTHGAKNGGSFSEMMGQSIPN